MVIVEIAKAYKNLKPNDVINVSETYAEKLIQLGVAKKGNEEIEAVEEIEKPKEKKVKPIK